MLRSISTNIAAWRRKRPPISAACSRWRVKDRCERRAERRGGLKSGGPFRSQFLYNVDFCQPTRPSSAFHKTTAASPLANATSTLIGNVSLSHFTRRCQFINSKAQGGLISPPLASRGHDLTLRVFVTCLRFVSAGKCMKPLCRSFIIGKASKLATLGGARSQSFAFRNERRAIVESKRVINPHLLLPLAPAVLP